MVHSIERERVDVHLCCVLLVVSKKKRGTQIFHTTLNTDDRRKDQPTERKEHPCRTENVRRRRVGGELAGLVGWFWKLGIVMTLQLLVSNYE